VLLRGCLQLLLVAVTSPDFAALQQKSFFQCWLVIFGKYVYQVSLHRLQVQQFDMLSE